MKSILLILFLVLSVFCYCFFLLAEAAPLWTGIVGVLGICVSLFFHIRSLITIYKNKKK